MILVIASILLVIVVSLPLAIYCALRDEEHYDTSTQMR